MLYFCRISMDIVPLILTYILGILSPVLLEHFPLYVEEHYSRESPVQMTGHTEAQEERRRGKQSTNSAACCMAFYSRLVTCFYCQNHAALDKKNFHVL